MTSENNPPELNLAELADSVNDNPEWQGWLAAHPQAANQVAAARQMRALLQQLRSLSVDVPEDIETRILSRVHRTTAVRELLNLNLSGSARALLELMTLLFSFLPASAIEEPPAARSA